MKIGDVVEYVGNSQVGIEIKRVGKLYQIRELADFMGQEAARCYKLKKDGSPDIQTNIFLLRSELKLVETGK